MKSRKPQHRQNLRPRPKTALIAEAAARKLAAQTPTQRPHPTGTAS